MGRALYFIKERICLWVKDGLLNVCPLSLRLGDSLSERLVDAITITPPNGFH